MDRSISPLNPFFALRSRYLVLGTFLIATVVMGSLYTLLDAWQLLPIATDDPILTPVSTIVVFTVMGGAIWGVSRARGLKISYLFGRNLTRRDVLTAARFSLPFTLFYGLLLVASLLLFSLGISSIFFYLLSWSFPGYVNQLLANNLLLNGQASLYPQLYDRLMLFLLLIYAPLVEELVFRGFLLQRWGTKWGLGWGIVGSSALFGLLHFNNPLGLMLFGLVMGLLYVRTRSLWVPIVCHALNNLAAVGIDRLARMTSGGQTSTIADIQNLWWISLILVGVSLPFLGWFVWKSWPHEGQRIPYLVNLGIEGPAE